MYTHISENVTEGNTSGVKGKIAERNESGMNGKVMSDCPRIVGVEIDHQRVY